MPGGGMRRQGPHSGVLSELLGEPGEGRRVDHLADLVGKYELETFVRFPGAEPFDALASAMLSEHRAGSVVECDDPSGLTGFRLPEAQNGLSLTGTTVSTTANR